MLARASSTVQYKGESREEYLSRITHTKLNNKGIERMENFECTGMGVELGECEPVRQEGHHYPAFFEDGVESAQL